MNLGSRVSSKLFSFLLLVIILNSFSQVRITKSYQNTTPNPLFLSVSSPLEFNASLAYNHISTQLDFGFRVPGSLDHLNCGNWLLGELSTYSDTVVVHNFTIQKEGQPSYNCRNILGKINTDKKDIVILGAHWDSRNVSEKDLFIHDQPIPGANDGGSGVGVLLELARVFSVYKDLLDCQLWFLLIDAEDQGYSRSFYGIQDWNWTEGSQIFVDNIDQFHNKRKEDFECFILLDMVGGNDLEFIRETRSDVDLFESVFELGRSLGYTNTFPEIPTAMTVTDDHLPFRDAGIPVIDLIIDFISGQWSYHHTLSDDLSNIDTESLNITGRTIETFVKNYYTEGLNNKWKETELSTGFYVVVSLAVGLIILWAIYYFPKTRKKKIRKE